MSDDALPGRQRVQALGEPQVRELLEHERTHDRRVPVLQVLEARLEQLQARPAPDEKAGP